MNQICKAFVEWMRKPEVSAKVGAVLSHRECDLLAGILREIEGAKHRNPNVLKREVTLNLTLSETIELPALHRKLQCARLLKAIT